MNVMPWLFESLGKNVIYRVPNRTKKGQRNIVFLASRFGPALFYFVLLGVVLAEKSALFMQCTYRNTTCSIPGMSKV